MSSTRLKPDEASAILQEEGDEARVGSLSVQIMAIVATDNRQLQQDETQDIAAEHPRGAAARSGVAAAGNVGTSSKPVGLAARGPGLIRRKLGGSSRMGSAGPSSPHTTGPLATNGSGSSSSAAVGGPCAADARPPPPSAPPAATPLKRNGLGGGGRGIGGARRFHAPRLSSSAAAAAAAGGGGTPSSNSSASAPACGKSTGRPSAPGTGSPRLSTSDRRSGVTANTATMAGAKVAAERSSENHRNSGAGSGGGAAAAVDPEGLVLEWTAGNPPQPVMAGASLARRLHPHQREGLKVLWECLAGRGG